MSTTTTRKFGGTKAALERAEALKAAAAPEQPAPVPPATAPEPVPGSPEQLLADAAAEVAEADALLTTLERRVIDGDDQVQPEQIEHARGLRRFAELRKQSAEKKAAKLRQEKAEQKRLAALAEARRLLDEYSPQRIAAKVDAARTALLELHRAIGSHNDNARQAWAVLSADRAVPATVSTPGRPVQLPEGLAWTNDHGRPILWDDGEGVIGRYNDNTVNSLVKEVKAQWHQESNRLPTNEEIQAGRRNLAQADARLYGTPAWVELPARRQAAAQAFLPGAGA
ncbi:hypothetical protein [Streptomyces sp. bgisy091]|uniref:hypothetical protein n=1 Tax=Streptomyces sp. bgisy091 TaxID=3413778 RepID=UPI003D71D61D